jgi:hypothetical protein
VSILHSIDFQNIVSISKNLVYLDIRNNAVYEEV